MKPEEYGWNGQHVVNIGTKNHVPLEYERMGDCIVSLIHVTVSLLSTLSLLPKCEGFGNSWSSPMIVSEQLTAT